LSNEADVGRRLTAEILGFLFVFVGAGSAAARQYLGILDPRSTLSKAVSRLKPNSIAVVPASRQFV
jgi:hypothetical protein